MLTKSEMSKFRLLTLIIHTPPREKNTKRNNYKRNSEHYYL